MPDEVEVAVQVGLVVRRQAGSEQGLLQRGNGRGMNGLHDEKMTLNEIGKLFNMSDSGVYRRIKKVEEVEE